MGIFISRITQLSPLGTSIAALDFLLVVPDTLDTSAMIQRVGDTPYDLCLLPFNAYRKHKRLVVFDMDSTLIRQECIDELAREHGVYDGIAPITESAMWAG
jgi:phosphoserine phosphatase